MGMFSRKDMIRLFGPLLVEQLLAVLVGMADVVMVAAVGETAVSGVALVDSISVLVIQVLSAMATGGAVVCSQYIGKKKPDQACRAAGQLVLITAALSLLIAAVAFIGNRHLLRLIFGSVETAVMDNAQTYFWFTAMSYPFLALYNSGAALFRSMGNSKVSMKVSLAMNAINVAGNALCVFGLHMGVEGVAIPTLVSRMFAAVVMVILVRNPKNSIRVDHLGQMIPQPDMIRKILAVGIPSGLENGMFQFGKIALQSLVSTLGTASIAGYAVATNLVTFQYLPGVALGLGLITIVGQCVGAGEPEQAKFYTRKVIAVNYGLLLVICTCSFPEPCGGNLQPFPGGIGSGTETSAGAFLRHGALAAGFRAAEYAACRTGREVYHDGFGIFHVGVPHRTGLCICQGTSHERAGNLVRHVCRLDLPPGGICMAVSGIFSASASGVRRLQFTGGIFLD